MTVLGFILGALIIAWTVLPLFKKLGFWVPLDDGIDLLEDRDTIIGRDKSLFSHHVKVIGNSQVDLANNVQDIGTGPCRQ